MGKVIIGYIKNKYDAIDPYKYHLVIENHKSKYHFTEKIRCFFRV